MRAMLMLSDREEISRGLAEGLQFKQIGQRLGRDPSVISREVGRHAMVACEINDRPRKILNWKKPSEIFAELVIANASTA